MDWLVDLRLWLNITANIGFLFVFLMIFTFKSKEDAEYVKTGKRQKDCILISQNIIESFSYEFIIKYPSMKSKSSEYESQ